MRNFWAEVVLYEWDTVEIMLTEDDRARFRSVQDLARDVALHGYYGGIRLIKATVKRFVDYCRTAGVALHDRNFSIRYHTNIPRQVGLAGSSAIITATLRCLMEFYDVDVPLDVQPSLVLSVERDELRRRGRTAGSRRPGLRGAGLHGLRRASTSAIVHGLRCYQYEPLDPALLPPLYLAYHHGFSEPTEVFHNDVRERFRRGDADVVTACARVGGPGGVGARGAARPGRGAAVAARRRELRRPPHDLQAAGLAGADGRCRAGLRRQRELRRLGRRDHRDIPERCDLRGLAPGARSGRLLCHQACRLTTS